MKKIIVLCKYNQARSITAAAALRRFFPREHIISAGIIAKPNIPIPSSILHILDEWGLEERDHRSTSTTDLPEIHPQDLILCADVEVRNVFVQQLMLDRVNFPNIFILEQFSRSQLEIPIDPVSLGEAETKNQLARSIVLAIRGVNKLLGNNPLVEMGSLPTNRQEHLETQSQFFESKSRNRLLIDAGFSIPDSNMWSPSMNLHFINPAKIEPIENLLGEKTVLISKFEIDKAPELFLSLKYFEWIRNLSLTFQIGVVAQPFESLPQNRRHESILGMIHS